MKYLIFINLILLVNYSQQRSFREFTQLWQANMLRHHDKCLVETGADAELALRIIPYGEYVDDHKVMCYMLCVCENLNVIHSDNSIDQNNFLDILYVDDPELLAQANFVDNCFHIKLHDPCESAFRVSECIYKSIQKVLDSEKPDGKSKA